MTSPEINVGLWIIAAAVIIPPASIFLSVFITRREVEQSQKDNDRRHLQHEAALNTVLEKLEQTRTDATTTMRAVSQMVRDEDEKVSGRLSKHVADLHEKINRVDKGLAALEVETRLTGKQVGDLGNKVQSVESKLDQVIRLLPVN